MLKQKGGHGAVLSCCANAPVHRSRDCSGGCKRMSASANIFQQCRECANTHCPAAVDEETAWKSQRLSVRARPWVETLGGDPGVVHVHIHQHKP